MRLLLFASLAEESKQKEEKARMNQMRVDSASRHNSETLRGHLPPGEYKILRGGPLDRWMQRSKNFKSSSGKQRAKFNVPGADRIYARLE